MQKEKLTQLSDPNVHQLELGIFTNWRQDAKVGNNRQIIPYYTADQCREILDYVCGCEGWANEYVGINDITFCNIGIEIEDKWVFKSDAGGGRKSTKEMSDIDSESFEAKTTATSAFVRSAKTWGIGRHLKLIPPVYLEIFGKNVKTPTGVELTSPEEITAYCNQISTSEGWLSWIYRANRSSFDKDEKALKLMGELKDKLKSFKQ